MITLFDFGAITPCKTHSTDMHGTIQNHHNPLCVLVEGPKGPSVYMINRLAPYPRCYGKGTGLAC